MSRYPTDAGRIAAIADAPGRLLSQLIKQGSAGAQANAMECLLHKAGFATTINGRFSAADGREVAEFRKSIGLSPVAVGGRRTWSALLSRGTTPHLNAGDTGKNVVRLQLTLRSAGFAKVPTTGRYGASTVAVIKTTQKSRHRHQTGKSTLSSGLRCKPARSLPRQL